MTLKKHLKSGIRLIIEGDANPVTIIIRLSKSQLYKVLDVVLPDDPVDEPLQAVPASQFNLRNEK